MPARIERRFRRIADQLRTAELVQRTLDVPTDQGMVDPFEAVGPATARRFAGFYSRSGMRRVLEAYGVHRALEERGLDSYHVAFSTSGVSDHRLQLLLDGVEDDDHRLLDLKVALRRLPEHELGGGGDRRLDVLEVVWLAMQDPTAGFTTERPRLPGQRYPGLGIGNVMHNMVLLMARRLRREAVLNVPERVHLALIYLEAGYLAVDDGWLREVVAAYRAVDDLPLAAAAWAAERGCLRRADGGQWSYRPGPVVAPVSRPLRRRVDGLGNRLRRRWRTARAGGVRLDREALRRSLEEDPVEGLPPESV